MSDCVVEGGQHQGRLGPATSRKGVWDERPGTTLMNTNANVGEIPFTNDPMADCSWGRKQPRNDDL